MQQYIADHLLEIIAILVAFFIWYLQSQKKAISYTILTNTSAVSVSDKAKDRIQILYDGEPVPNLRLIEIRIQNTGNLPIKPDDYIQPLAIRLSEGMLLSADSIDSNSVGANIVIWNLSQAKAEIVLSKTLLNPKDYYDVKILMAEGEPDISVFGRIVGISKIQTSSNLRPSINVKLSTLVPLTIFYVAIILGFVSEGKYTVLESVGYVSAIFLGSLLLIYLLKFLEEYDKRHER